VSSNTSVHLPDATYKQVKAEAARRNLRMSAVLVLALEEYFVKHAPKTLSPTKPTPVKQVAITDEWDDE